MYKVSVPLKNRILNRKNRGAYLEDLKRCGALSAVILNI